MSYYNQPDHERIDRRDEGARRTLLRLASARVRIAPSLPPPALANGSSDAVTDWKTEAAARGLPSTDPEPLTVEGTTIPLVWRRHYLVALHETATTEVLARLDDLGFEVVRFEERSSWSVAFDRLVNVLGRSS